MNNSSLYQPITIKEVFLSSLGLDEVQNTGSANHETLLPLAAEEQFSRALQSWSGFCAEMSAWYVERFSDQPIILISAPTMEMCVRHQVPARRGFILRTLGRIIEEMGSDAFVGIVDCKHDPLTDPDLAKLANHWIHEFSGVGQFPYAVDGESRYLHFAN